LKTVQLRRYEILPGELPAFVSWWSEWMPTVRTDAGFTIEFAYVDEENNEFVWAVSTLTDRAGFEAIEDAYMKSAERARAFDGVPDRTAAKHVSIVTSLTDGEL
jgi:hypothetical protein